MTTHKLIIDNHKLDLNLKFYFLLKNLVKSKLTEKQIYIILDLANPYPEYTTTIEKLNEYVLAINSDTKREAASSIIEMIEEEIDIELLLFSLRLYLIKDLLLEEAKLTSLIDRESIKDLNPLSLEYDKKSVFRPYTTRVNGALLSLLFFSRLENGDTNFMSTKTEGFLKLLSNQAISLKKYGIEPNQIFMLMFTESINQSITSDSGVNYEDRILSALRNIGIPERSIKKLHDEGDASTEYDFFFKLDNRTFGIGAKRTLRERYKQFIKTAHTSHIDIMIEITLGTDLSEAKARTILSHGIKLFVSDEIYKSREFLQNLDGVYSVCSLNLETLRSLTK